MDQAIFDEIVALNHLRVQKVFSLFKKILIMELYSPAYKRLFFVFDQNPKTKTLHVQKERPRGTKTKSQLTALLNKYAIGQFIEFFKEDKEDSILTAKFKKEGKSYTLQFDFFKRFSVGLFYDDKLLASLGQTSSRCLTDEFFKKAQHSNLGLATNFAHAALYEKKLLTFYKKSIFDERLATIKRELKKKETLLKNVEGDHEKCQKNLAMSEDLELLRANLHTLKRGMKEAIVINYATDPPSQKKIPLDPLLSPQEFLEKSFNKVKRAKRGINVIQERISYIKNDIKDKKQEIDDILKAGPEALSIGEIQETFEAKKKSSAKKQRLPYRSYISSDKIKILVGKSARDSDDLTLHYAHGNDWWFHARDQKGAHVIVKSNLLSLPNNTLLEAAMLAAHFSKDRLNLRSTIQYTRAKFVKKPKGLAAGKVLISQEKTLEIEMNDAILKQLLKSGN